MDLTSLRTALKQRAGIVPAEESAAGKQLKLLCRLDQSKMPGWKVIMHRLKKAELDASWTLDISKVFFLKNSSPHGALVHGWRIIIKDDNLQQAVVEITKLIASAPNARVEVTEILLPGGGVHRNINSSAGKGASTTGYSKGSGPALHLIGR